MATKESLWTKLVTSGEEEIAAGRAAIAEEVLKHRFASAHTDAKAQILDLRTERENILNALAKNPLNGAERFDVNRLVNISVELKELDDALTAIEAEYVAMFGTDDLSRSALVAEAA